MFWCFTGVLTSKIAVEIEKNPLNSLNDLHLKSNFKLYHYGGASTGTMLLKWANQSEENMKSYENLIKPYSIMSEPSEYYQEVMSDNEVAILIGDNQIFRELNLCKLNVIFSD